ncbi:MAG TPA: DUF2877 domain-containing protein [Hyphomicrobiaceae bacterium]|nr:DUF2877 domain-containing protein [Hyphomicrobiaceae bacterium]
MAWPPMIGAFPGVGLTGSLVGPSAARALRAGATGRVGAVFERSLYLALDSGWIAVGGPGLGGGPLNLVCAPGPDAPLSAIVAPGAAVRITASACQAGSLTVAIAGVTAWRPAPVGAWTKASLAHGLAAVGDVVRQCRPAASGLIGHVFPELGPVLPAAAAPLRRLSEMLAGARFDPGAIVPLIGLGPGLTPSGDDYLGGVLVALALTARLPLRDRLWQALVPGLGERTSAISAAHLAAAAEGFGCAALHEVLGALLTGAGDRLPAAVAALARVGHTSGWDALAGAIAALRVVGDDLAAR